MTKRMILCLSAVGGLACAGAEAGPPQVGDPAPPFTAFALDGTEVSSDQLVGSPYMLNVWATWCGPCRKEMPELQELHDEYSAQGFSVVGVSVDNRAAGDAIEMFVDELGLDFPIYHDPSAGIQDSYFLLGLPGTFLVDGEGVIVRKWTGPFRPMEPDVQADVRALLASATGQD